MHGPTRAFGLALFIKRFGNSESVGVDFDDRVQTDSFLLFTGGAAAVIVDFTDSTQVCFSQRMSGNFAGGHATLKVGNRRFLKLKGLRRRWRWIRNHGAGGRECRQHGRPGCS